MDKIKDIQIDVNCITSYPTHLVDNSTTKELILAVEEYKKTDEWKSVEKPDYMYLEGRRFHDNERVVHAILGNVRLCINKAIFDNSHGDMEDPLNSQLMEDVFVKYLSSLTNSVKGNNTLKEWIKSALLYSAGSDYWYTYEKEW